MIKSIKYLIPYIIALVLLVVDQWSKALVRQHMHLGESIPLIPNVFHLTYIENDGVAFGLFAGHTGIFLIVSLCVLVGLVLFAWKEDKDSTLLHYGVALVVSGALGNIIDRAYKASVTDMFDLRIFAIFNVADIAVCVGVALLVLYVFLDSREKDGQRTD